MRLKRRSNTVIPCGFKKNVQLGFGYKIQNVSVLRMANKTLGIY